MRIADRSDLAAPMSSERDATAALVRADVLVLLRERRYEEALAMLYRARADSPDSTELQKSIDQIKEFLIGAYAKRLGGLDQIAQQMSVNVPRSPDVVMVSRYIDGSSTFGDIAQMCPLGQLRTLQVLVGLYRKPDAPPPSAEIEQTRSGMHTIAPRIDESTPLSVKLPSDDDAPETARSTGSPPPLVQPVVETESDRRYKAAFQLGTAAYIQRRFADAVAAFRSCDEIRPGDKAADVMLRRAQKDLDFESR
ncbi:MAG TPA: TRP-like protein [Polyangiaceae bacterium]|nr:TRP-like protein [Polyangiaceae bacterium]